MTATLQQQPEPSEAVTMAKDELAGEPWVSAPLLGHLPGDPGTVPSRGRAPGGATLARDAPAFGLPGYGIVLGAIVLFAEIVLAIATMP
ncbi:hypothetical protein [Benzoatithermus flavus]|uniref:Uncharacterized protein n=1 Tax=Benzoatithermus flavus TaxID=3108223 RepID=A0ABU8XX63_9PROT